MTWSLYARGLAKAKLGDAEGAKADREAALKQDPPADRSLARRAPRPLTALELVVPRFPLDVYTS